jgi:hypothetical protein
VPCVVQPSIMYTGLAEQCLPLVIVGVQVERAAVWPDEYPSFVVPELAGGPMLSFLLFLAGLQ